VAHALDPARLVGPIMSVEEWASLSEDVPGEIVEGRLVEEEMPDYAHEVLVALLARLLDTWAAANGAIVGTSDARFAVAPNLGRKPDLSVFFAGRRPPRRGIVRIPPDIAVEVVSSGPRDAKRDRVEKMAEYAAFGVHWYWIVDPDRRSVQIHELGPDRQFRLVIEATANAIDVPGCVGLQLDPQLLWNRIDELTD
jgi:Uma2 family endonuclease